MWNNIYIPSFFLYNCFLKIHMFFQSAFSYWCHFWFFLKFSSQLLSFFRSHICFPSIEALMPFQHIWRFLLQLHNFFPSGFFPQFLLSFFLKNLFLRNSYLFSVTDIISDFLKIFCSVAIIFHMLMFFLFRFLPSVPFFLEIIFWIIHIFFSYWYQFWIFLSQLLSFFRCSCPFLSGFFPQFFFS